MVMLKDWAPIWAEVDGLMSDGHGRSLREIIEGVGLVYNARIFTYVHRRMEKLVSGGTYGCDRSKNAHHNRRSNVYFKIDPSSVFED